MLDARMDVVYVPGPDHLDRDKGLELAAKWLSSIAKNSADVMIVVPVQASTEHSPVLGRLASRYPVETARTVNRRGFHKGVVLAVWPREDTLATIAGGRPRAICVVQWSDEDTNNWLSAHGARDLSGRAPALISAEIADPIVRVALDGMSVNPNNALVQLEDREMAILTLRLLHERGRPIDPNELYRWAVSVGWPGEGPENLRTLGREVLAGVRHRLRDRRPFGDDVYAAWEREAAKT